MIRNFLSCNKELESSHDGVGSVEVQHVFERADFQGAWDHALRVVMPAGTSIGAHTHEQNEEMYIILRGKGLMLTNGQEQRVGPGDMILNPPGGTHGLANDSDSDIELLIIQASLDADSHL